MSIKLELYKKCHQLIDEKIVVAEKAMKDAQNSANSEEKSTAGDKYDTARAMSHIERDMYAKQLQESVKLKKAMRDINMEKEYSVVESGALVDTSQATYFVAVPLGKITFGNRSIFAVSPVSPLGQVLMGKQQGDEVTFNGKGILINSIQ